MDGRYNQLGLHEEEGGGGGVMLLSVYSRLAAWDDHKTDFTAPVRSIDARFVFCQLLPDF